MSENLKVQKSFFVVVSIDQSQTRKHLIREPRCVCF